LCVFLAVRLSPPVFGFDLSTRDTHGLNKRRAGLHRPCSFALLHGLLPPCQRTRVYAGSLTGSSHLCRSRPVRRLHVENAMNRAFQSVSPVFGSWVAMTCSATAAWAGQDRQSGFGLRPRYEPRRQAARWQMRPQYQSGRSPRSGRLSILHRNGFAIVGRGGGRDHNSCPFFCKSSSNFR
jgi:hypothetical protein